MNKVPPGRLRAAVVSAIALSALLSACSSGSHPSAPSTSRSGSTGVPASSVRSASAVAQYVQTVAPPITGVFRTNVSNELLIEVPESTAQRRSACWVKYSALASYPTASQVHVTLIARELKPAPTCSHARVGPMYASVRLVVDYTNQSLVDAATGAPLRVLGTIALGSLKYPPVN